MVEITKILPIVGKGKKIPSHVALSTGLVKPWAEAGKKDFAECAKKHFDIISSMVDYQIKNEVRVMTIGLSDCSPEILPEMKSFFLSLLNDERLQKNQVRVFIIGQWYELDTELSDVFKLAMEKTKHFDNLFLNFCVKYDGHEEVLGALRLITRKILADKLAEGDLSPEMVKENIYSSYFPPPELIVETQRRYSGLLLWDSKGAVQYYSEKDWMEFDRKEMDEALAFYNRVSRADD